MTGLLHCNTGQFITLLNVLRDLNLWVRVTHEIHKYGSPMNNDNSTVFDKLLNCNMPISLSKEIRLFSIIQVAYVMKRHQEHITPLSALEKQNEIVHIHNK